MSQISSIRPPVENNINPWLLDGLLPRNLVVLLDGFAGVGKTALLALLTQKITEQNKKRTVLYLSSPRQMSSRDIFLQRQRASFGQLHAVSFHPQEKSLQNRQVFIDLLDCIVHSLHEKQPHCMIIDGLEDLLAEELADARLSRQFWQTLHRLAESTQCTIIVTRNKGFHESRAYGHFTRAASELCSFALAMHWHPQSTAERVVTIARHRLGPVGKQFHLKFADNRAELLEKTHAENVRPARTPPHALPPKPVKTPGKQDPSSTNTATEPVPAQISTVSITPLPVPNNDEKRAHEVEPIIPTMPPILERTITPALERTITPAAAA
jgi:archaellum biogenesis ATPase FlaH